MQVPKPKGSCTELSSANSKALDSYENDNKACSNSY